MDVSVIIVNYHSEELIERCVKSVNEQTSGISYEIIIVDNGGGESALRKLGKIKSEQIRVIASEVNLGFGKANNLGASCAQGKYLFLLNPDTELMNNAIRILYDYMESHPETGISGGNLYSSDGMPVPSYCMEYDTLKKEETDSTWLTIIFSKIAEKTKKKKTVIDQDRFNDTGAVKEVAYIFGADMFMKKELFDSVGGFDPDFFMYAEEEELTRRIHDRGLKIMSVPDARIIHLEGGTTTEKPGFSEKQFRMRMNGKMVYYDKCYPPNGADDFYRYRLRRYQRLIRWQQLKGRNPSGSAAMRSLEILKQAYEEHCRTRRKNG